jgi:regulator of cell morphogenesis and NO signaling
MRRIAADYVLPPGACTKYTILFQRLEELEADVHEHMHLENNILFPRAATLEETMRQTTSGG